MKRSGFHTLPLLLILLIGSAVGLTSVARPASANFQYQVYTGSFSALPNFTSLTPSASGQSTTIGVSVTNLTNNFALVFTNTLNAPNAGYYEFRLNSDEGSRLYIDGVLVVDDNGLHIPQVREGSRPPGSDPRSARSTRRGARGNRS